MSTITLSKQIDSETLHLPELLPFIGHRVEIVVRDFDSPPPLKADRDGLWNALKDTIERCQFANWDGEGAIAISSATSNVAKRFLESLPVECPSPQITPEPDGQLNFEWYQSPRRLLTVSIEASGMLYWAALIDSEDPRGSCQFNDLFPQTLQYWIGQVYV